MRITIFLGALVGLAAAVPYPQEQEDPNDPDNDDSSEYPTTISASFATPTSPITLSTSLNIPITGSPGLPFVTATPRTVSSGHKNSHWEPIPVFTKECQCNLATARYPCWATDSLQRCHYEENFSYGCYMAAAGGCPTPTRECTKLFQPTPRSGKNPCEMGGSPPEITSVPVLPSLNVSMSFMPNANATITPTANATIMAPMVSANVTLPVQLPFQT